MADLTAAETVAAELVVPDLVLAALPARLPEDKIRFLAAMPGWRDRKLGPARLLIESYHQWLDEHGWQIVPKQATDEMLDALDVGWSHALAVAPKPEAG